MPCTDGGVPYPKTITEHNLDKIEKLTRILCYVKRFLPKTLPVQPEDFAVYKEFTDWAKEHDEKDRVRLAKEIALGKLTLEERKLLGIK